MAEVLLASRVASGTCHHVTPHQPCPAGFFPVFTPSHRDTDSKRTRVPTTNRLFQTFTANVSHFAAFANLYPPPSHHHHHPPQASLPHSCLSAQNELGSTDQAGGGVGEVSESRLPG